MGVRGQCCFTSTETVRTIRDGEPRTATSTFTQIMSSGLVSECHYGLGHSCCLVWLTVAEGSRLLSGVAYRSRGVMVVWCGLP